MQELGEFPIIQPTITLHVALECIKFVPYSTMGISYSGTKSNKIGEVNVKKHLHH
jgi:hypothetical protein